MIEAKQFEVDGVQYRLTMFGAKAGQKLLVRVVKVIAPALGQGANDVSLGRSGGVELGSVRVAEAVESFCNGVDPAMFAEICESFAAKCEFSTDDGATFRPLGALYDDHFAGRYLALLRWVGESFRVNYADFFGELGPRLQAFMQTTRAASPSLSTSTGASTGSPAQGSTATG